MRRQLVLAFLCISIIWLSGCIFYANLEPVQGLPLASPHRAQIETNGIFNSGRFRADLEEDQLFNSDACKGRWKASTRSKPPSTNDMASVWDTVYGDGYYGTQIVGAKKCGRGSGSCKQGEVLDAEVCQIESKQN